MPIPTSLKRVRVIVSALALASLLQACATSTPSIHTPEHKRTPPPPPDTAAVQQAERHHEEHQMAKLEGARSRVVSPASPDASGEPSEVATLLDEPGLKLMTVTLRNGTDLPEHKTPYPVTIQAIRGSGTVIADGERLALPTNGVVVLAPGVPHSVEPDGMDTMMLLVHHLRSPASQAEGHAH